MQCPNCGKENQNSSKFCKYCGYPLQLSESEAKSNEEETSSTKKAILFFCIFVAVVFILVLAMNATSSIKTENPYSEYYKNNVNNQIESNRTENQINTDENYYNKPVKSEEELFSEVASTFRHYYQSYISASNEQNSDWIDHCTESIRVVQKERIYKNNANYTIENVAIWLDMNSFLLGYDKGYGEAYFNVSIDNNAWHRQTGEYVFNNPAFSVEMICEQDVWLVSAVNTIDRVQLGSDYRDITNY